MRFTKDTLEILQNFSQINSGMQFRKGSKQATVSSGKTVIAISNFDIEIPQSFAVYELSKFLGILSLIDDPEIELGDEYAVITNDNGQKVKYRYCEPRMIISWPEDKKESLASVDVSFDLPKEVWTKFNKSSNLLSGEHMNIESENGNIVMRTIDKEDIKASSASFSVGTSDQNFSLSFQRKLMNLMPGNYLVELCRNKLTRWTNKDKNIIYYIASEKTSTFE